MKKGKKVLVALGCVVLAIAVGAGVWYTVVHEKSKKYNMISLDTSLVPEPVDGPSKEADVQLSEVKMHYAVYGEGGHPLILIHGNARSHKDLDETARYLGKTYTVYSIDSRCHGESSDPGEISYELMAKDVKEFCEKLKLEKPYVVGHSDGAIVAITAAYTYPDLFGAVVSCGANSHPETFKPYFTLAVKYNNKKNHDKLNDMMLEEPQMTTEELSKIICPIYIVAGEFDIMWLSDTVFIHESIQKSEIAIIKSGNHSSYIMHDGKQAYALINGWLSKLEDSKQQ